MRNEGRVRLVGTATFVALAYFVVYGIWFAITAVGSLTTGRIGTGRTAFLGIWLTTIVYLAVALWLLVQYLRHLSQDSRAPSNKVLWTILLLFTGPIGMTYYWLTYVCTRPPEARGAAADDTHL